MNQPQMTQMTRMKWPQMNADDAHGVWIVTDVSVLLGAKAFRSRPDRHQDP
jgi:hypothetical protein